MSGDRQEPLPPGKTLELVLDEKGFRGQERKAFVAYLEQKAKREGDLRSLREIRAYLERYREAG